MKDGVLSLLHVLLLLLWCLLYWDARYSEFHYTEVLLCWWIPNTVMLKVFSCPQNYPWVYQKGCLAWNINWKQDRRKEFKELFLLYLATEGWLLCEFLSLTSPVQIPWYSLYPKWYLLYHNSEVLSPPMKVYIPQLVPQQTSHQNKMELRFCS